MSGCFQSDSPTALRVCVSCGRSPEDGVKLMKCNGCTDAPTYCSKECQKLHWPMHKSFCQFNSNKRRLLANNLPCAAPSQLQGSATLEELTATWNDYLHAHEWALETVLKISTLLQYNFGRTPQPDNTVLQLWFTRSPNEPSRNPACGFTLTAVAWHETQDSKQIGEFTAARANSLAHYKRVWSQSQDTPPDNAVLGLLTLAGTVHSSLQCFPWYNPHHGGIGSGEGEGVRVPLEDLRHICLTSLDTEFPIRSMRTEEGLPLPGRYERVNKQWVWKPLFSSWEDYVGGRTGYGPLRALEGLKSGMPPHHLMLLYFNI